MSQNYSLIERMEVHRDKAQKVMEIFLKIKDNINQPNNHNKQLHTTEHAYNIFGEVDINLNSKKKAINYFKKHGLLQVHADKVNTNTELPVQYFAYEAFNAMRNAYEKLNMAEDEIDNNINNLTDQIKFLTRASHIKKNISTWMNSESDRNTFGIEPHRTAWARMSGTQQDTIIEECIKPKRGNDTPTEFSPVYPDVLYSSTSR